MRVQLIDPSAFTPPYDRALAAALGRSGVEVELLTSRFLHGDVPAAEGFEVSEAFYRRTSQRGLEAPARLPFKLAEHLPDMLRLRRRLDADVSHYQWLTVPWLDAALLSRRGPRVMTAHYVLRERPTRAQLRAARFAFGPMDAVIAHSRHSAARLRDEVGIPDDRIRVIPHGAFDYLTRIPQAPLPSELAGAEGPVILFFGLLRPYKGLDVLLEAFRGVPDAELWIVGKPRMDVDPLKEVAARAPGRVRFLSRFVAEAEIAPIMQRADVLVCPYLHAEHSGVLYTGLAFGKAMVLSDVGGFGELAREDGAARIVAPGRAGELAHALREVISDSGERSRLQGAATRAARSRYSWDAVAAQTLALYEELIGTGR